jgi:P-type Cu2+ transporter
MSCCAPGIEASLQAEASSPAEELRLASRDLGDGTFQTDLSVPGVHCAACIAAVEKSLQALPGVEHARVNLSMKRASVKWRAGAAPDLIGALRTAGYAAHPFTVETSAGDPEYSRLVKALAVAGFCAMNIMLLSVSVWAGASGGTRQAFHLISAVLAVPAIVYSGRIFFLSAWSALRHGRTNMDVPISVGVLLAFGLSLYDTLNDGTHAYFDAATTLLFFLLIGRTLDHLMREKARSAVAGLARLTPRGATVVEPDGARRYLPLAEIEPGTALLIAAGDRIPLDGIVTGGVSDLDRSLVSGEAAPEVARAGTRVQSGLMNLTGALTMRTTARAEDSFLAEMVRMMEAAEGGQTGYRRIADRAAALYSPVVHLVALATLLGWFFVTLDWHASITVAIAVLIITCPCALGLAVPIVQVVAARRLFERGILVKDGSALERLAGIDTVLFDKTGTLTLGSPRIVNVADIDPAALGIAASMAAGSRHPLSAAIAAEARKDIAAPIVFDRLGEQPGNGLEAYAGDTVYRLGRPDWALGKTADAAGDEPYSMVLLARDGVELARFKLESTIRPGAAATVAGLQRQGVEVEILSGDREAAVAALASRLGVERFGSALLPAEKVARIEALRCEGHRVLMVGDGLNDAPALAAADISMAPASAADIGRTAAGFVFMNESLSAVSDSLQIARNANTLVRENFALAIGYNVIAVPIAVSGHVTPLLAAVAMSLSSVVVVANAMRLGRPDARKPSWRALFDAGHGGEAVGA